MKRLTIITALFISSLYTHAQSKGINSEQIKEDLDEIINDIEQNYIYLSEKKVDLDCLRQYYSDQIENIKTEEETVLFFEYLLDEFYDSHLLLRTNRNSSFRLYSPVYARFEKEKLMISNVWQTQIENLNEDIIDAEILRFNEESIEQAIENFPTHCNNKSLPEAKEWIANKIIAGRYNEPRVLTLQLKNNQQIQLDLDQIQLKQENELLSAQTINEIGIIRINNSLGKDDLVSKFDQALAKLSNTKGLIIDLRNTISGGDSYEARGIMSKFIQELKPYQRHSFMEKSFNNPDVERSWIEYVSPRSNAYEQPVSVLVGRWTGSMGEGLAIGFEGMERAQIVGTEMRRLAGEVFDFGFIHQNYGYKLATTKLYHVNGSIREKYIPTHYVKQTTTTKDETLEKGIELILEMTR